MCCFNNIFENCNFWVILIALLIIISMCGSGDGVCGRDHGYDCGCN
ncbi:MAG: hypothetical protein IJA85_02180 [Clostridia bacterium]|nr:hypothetical protein [Clostridia bacterium]MBQ4573979.1 hypothetical protein [Clostridia bacterium]